MLYLIATLVRSTTRHGWSLLRHGFQYQLGCLTFSRDTTLQTLNSVAYKIFVLSWASYPMQGNGDIEPAVLHGYRKSF